MLVNQRSKALMCLCAHRKLEGCITVTPAVSRSALPAESPLTRPGCFPTTRSSCWPNAPKPNTGNAVSATCRHVTFFSKRTDALTNDMCVCSSSRRALHPFLYWEKLHALHQMFQRHASVSSSTDLSLRSIPPFLNECSASVFCRESRTHCIDIETAYVQGCEMLDQAVLVRPSPCLWL